MATWTLVLRCYGCAARFTLPHLNFDTVTSLPLVAPCPYCGGRPVIRAKGDDGESRMHKVLDLRYDRGREPVSVGPQVRRH
jgi:rRNA maturation endonuclease Nob1